MSTRKPRRGYVPDKRASDTPWSRRPKVIIKALGVILLVAVAIDQQLYDGARTQPAFDAIIGQMQVVDLQLRRLASDLRR